MADKKISELTTASEIKNGDNLELSQDTGDGALVSLKATILAIANKMLKGINFTSDLDTTNKTVIGAINEIAQGGGGGAGHTILDDDGTALAQEDDLQFKGVYSVDNSTDGVTEVNVYREMTKAEFDLLSDDEKKGFINVTDEPSMASVVDGVFIDTNNVIQATTQISASGLSYTATEDCFVYIYLWGGNSTTVKINDVYIAGNFSNDKDVYLIPLKKGQTLTTTSGNALNTYTVYGIQQGSNVVKYNYSTDEQIVGTWIDGKTLYEKTFYMDDFTGVTLSGFNIVSGLTGIDKAWITEGNIKNNDGNTFKLDNYLSSNAYAYVMYQSTGNIRAVIHGFNPVYLFVTLRYTKSS